MSAPTVRLVGSATIAGGTGIGTVSGTFTAGSRIVTIFTSETSSGAHTVTDDKNAGSYAADMLNQVSFRATTVGSASKVNTFTGSITVTITVGVNATGKMAVFELTNENGFDAGGGNDGDSSSSTAGGVGPTVSVTPATANCAAFGMYVSGAGNASTMDSGYSAAWSPAGLNLKFHSGEYIADSGSGIETVTFGLTAGSNGTWHLGLALYKGASGPSTPNVSGTSSATPAEGSTLTITGTSFGATQGTGSVKIGVDEQQVLSWSDTSIQVRVCKALEKNGAAVNLVVTDGVGTPSSAFALTSLQPQAGYSYVDIGTPASTGVLPASPALATGDQVEYDNVGTLATVATNGVPAVNPSVRQFRWRVWSATGGGWGNWALQEIELTAVLWSTAVPSGNDVWLRVPDATAAGTLAAGLAAETDTALALAGVQLRATGLASESDTALALAPVQARATGLASESDAALGLVALQLRATGLAAEIDSALPLGGVQLRATGLASEADSALGLSPLQLRAAGLAAETNTALALSPGASSAAGIALETDSAQPLAGLQIRAAGLGSETDSALALAPLQIRAAGLCTSTETALALAPLAIRAAGLAAETDTALALTGGVNGTVGIASEADTALALAGKQIRAIGLASEAGTVLALAPVAQRAAGIASETDAALPLVPRQILPAGLAVETDQALARGAGASSPVGLALESSTALACAPVALRPVGLSSELAQAFAVAGRQLRAIGIAIEFDTALALGPVGTAGLVYVNGTWQYKASPNAGDLLLFLGPDGLIHAKTAAAAGDRRITNASGLFKAGAPA